MRDAERLEPPGIPVVNVKNLGMTKYRKGAQRTAKEHHTGPQRIGNHEKTARLATILYFLNYFVYFFCNFVFFVFFCEFWSFNELWRFMKRPF